VTYLKQAKVFDLLETGKSASAEFNGCFPAIDVRLTLVLYGTTRKITTHPHKKHNFFTIITFTTGRRSTSADIT